MHSADPTALASAADAVRDDVRALAGDIHAHPETAWEERRSAAALQDFLRERGFEVEAGIADVETAFRATSGSGDLHVGVFLEYDALPGMGHACGHNLILGAGLTAALALAEHADELGVTVVVLGTPAEEHGGGKIPMLAKGAFDDLHLVMMIHTAPDGQPYDPVGGTSNSITRQMVTYIGRGAHAAAAPHRGINAADALVLAQVAIGLLRQQLPGDHRVAVRTIEAGEATNIIAERAVAEVEYRATSLEDHLALEEKVFNCLRAGALATGCELDITESQPMYAPLLHDEALCAAWSAAMAGRGYDTTPRPGVFPASTDFGNVSQVVPAIHPWVSLPGVDAQLHTAGYAEAADTDAAYQVMHDAGTAMAQAAAALAADDARRAELLERHASATPASERAVRPGAADGDRTAQDAGETA